MAGIVVRNLADQLVDARLDRILSGQVSADHAIRQDALASELGGKQNLIAKHSSGAGEPRPF